MPPHWLTFGENEAYGYLEAFGSDLVFPGLQQIDKASKKHQNHVFVRIFCTCIPLTWGCT